MKLSKMFEHEIREQWRTQDLILGV